MDLDKMGTGWFGLHEGSKWLFLGQGSAFDRFIRDTGPDYLCGRLKEVQLQTIDLFDLLCF